MEISSMGTPGSRRTHSMGITASSMDMPVHSSPCSRRREAAVPSQRWFLVFCH